MLRPKMPDFAAAFKKNCGKCCDVLSTFVAIKLRETVTIAHTPSLISLHIQLHILKTVFTPFLYLTIFISLTDTCTHSTDTHTQTEISDAQVGFFNTRPNPTGDPTRPEPDPRNKKIKPVNVLPWNLFKLK